MKLCPMLQVDDVEASARWYRDVVGLVPGHGGNAYEMLFAGEPFATPLLLPLHRWNAHEHRFMAEAEAFRGSGVSLWGEVPDLEALHRARQRALDAGGPVPTEVGWNPLAHHHEFTARDPDGYVVVLATPFDANGP